MAKKKEPPIRLPNIERLSSGAWHTRVQIGDHRKSITKDSYDECVAEYLALKHSIIEATANPQKKTLHKAIDEYIAARKNILSPATIRGYRTIQAHRFQSMMKRNIADITPDQWQKAVNLEAKSVSAKTLTNSWRFIASVISEATGQKVTVRLPQIIPASRPWLAPEQIPGFVKAVKGDKAEIPALLALSSLRRSEIVGLRWSDVDLAHNLIHVNGAAVPDENNQLVYKRETKNASSRRSVPIIPPLKDALLRAENCGEYVVAYRPDTIMHQVNRVCDRNGFPRVGLHGLRHSFASLAYHLGMPEKVAMEIGGWANDQTMHKIYTHISRKSVSSAAERFTSFFSEQPTGEMPIMATPVETPLSVAR